MTIIIIILQFYKIRISCLNFLELYYICDNNMKPLVNRKFSIIRDYVLILNNIKSNIFIKFSFC